MTGSRRTFGVEIEALGLSREQARDAIIATGQKALEEQYNHFVTPHWKVITDRTVPEGFEAVSPILSGEKGVKQASKAAQAIKKSGGYTDFNCGFHVHVGIGDLSPQQLSAIVKRYGVLEKTIDAVVSSNRRGFGNRYCHSVNYALAIRGPMPVPDGRTTMFEHRYYKLNVASVKKYGTIEFRHHHGTLDHKRVDAWIRFCVNFVNTSVIFHHHRRTFYQPDFPDANQYEILFLYNDSLSPFPISIYTYERDKSIRLLGYMPTNNLDDKPIFLPTTKINEAVVVLLSRPNGAAIWQLIGLTGWRESSIRSAISYLKWTRGLQHSTFMVAGERMQKFRSFLCTYGTNQDDPFLGLSREAAVTLLSGWPVQPL